MKVQRKNKKNIIITSLVAVLFIIFSIGSYIYLNRQPNNKDLQIQNSDNSSASENEQILNNKREAIEEPQENSTNNKPIDESVRVTTKQIGDAVIISTELNGISSGDCDLSINNGGASYSDSATIIYQSQFSTCAGFSVNTSELGTGFWNINLNIKTSSGNISKETTIEVN